MAKMLYLVAVSKLCKTDQLIEKENKVYTIFFKETRHTLSYLLHGAEFFLRS